MGPQDIPSQVCPRVIATLAGQAIWVFVRRLAWSLLLAVSVSIPLALLIWKLTVSDSTVSQSVSAGIGIVLVICYLGAGMLWAVHRSYAGAVQQILPLFASQSLELLNGVFDRLLVKSPLHDQQIALADARLALQTLRGDNVWGTDPAVNKESVTRRLLRTVVRPYVRIEAALVNELLNSLESNGETHISAISLKRYLQDKLIQAALDVARTNVRAFGLASAVIAFLLALAPVAVAWIFFV